MKKLTAIVLCLGCVLSLQAANNAAMQSPANIPAANIHDVNSADDILIKKINDVLHSSAFSEGFENIKVDVKNGVVILNGFVNSNSDKARIESKIKEFPGVRSIDSKLTVQKAIPQSRNEQGNENDQYTADAISNQGAAQISQDLGNTANDQQLNAKIRQALSNAKIGKGFDAIILNTNGGIVSVEGVVADINDQQKLIIEIRKIDGVKAVKNNLQIKNN